MILLDANDKAVLVIPVTLEIVESIPLYGIHGQENKAVNFDILSKTSDTCPTISPIFFEKEACLTLAAFDGIPVTLYS